MLTKNGGWLRTNSLRHRALLAWQIVRAGIHPQFLEEPLV
jgi:hypothetical protein